MSNKKKDREWLDSLKEMYKIREYSKMYSELLSYLEKYPTDDYGKFLYCNVLIKLEKYDEALVNLEELENCGSKIKYQVYLLLANVYSKKKNKGKTLDMINNFLEGPYRDNNQLIILSKTYLNIGDKRMALKTIKKIKGIETTGLNNIVEAADVYSLLGMSVKSEELLNNIIIANLSSNLVLNMSRIKEQNKNYKGALGLVKYEINSVTSNDLNYFNLKLKECQLLIKRHKTEEAIDNCYKLLLDNKADKDSVYLILGDAYLEKYLYHEAKENYEAVLNSESSDNRVEAIHKLAYLSNIGNHLDEALLYNDLLIEEKTKYKTEALFNKMSINIRQEKYQEAYSLLKKVKNAITYDEFMGYRIALVYLNKVLGLEQDELVNYSYTEEQIINYNKELCLNHIIDHRKISGAFNNSINIEELIKNTENKLTKENISYGDFFDIYEIDYKSVGQNGKDRYRVVTIPNTKDIITMYPIENDDFKYHKVSKFIEKENKYNKEIVEKRKKLYSKFYKD